MPMVSINLDDAKFSALNECAKSRGVAVDALINENIDEFLNRQTAFRAAAKQVLKKNEELYVRLAR
jgi:predicted transcriptional regulator